MNTYLKLFLATVIPCEIFTGTALSVSARQVPIELLNVSSYNTEDVLGKDQFYIARALSPNTNTQEILTPSINVNSVIQEGKKATTTIALALSETDTDRFVAGTRAAICGPEKKGLSLRGHGFNVKKATIFRDNQGKPLYVSGQISHRLSWRRDDQVFYYIQYENGIVKKTDIDINRGGWGPIFGYISTAVNIYLLATTGSGVPVTPDVVERTFQELTKGSGGWEHQAHTLIGLISMAATNPNYCQ